MQRVQVREGTGPQAITPRASPIFSPVTSNTANAPIAGTAASIAESLKGFGGALSNFAMLREEERIEQTSVQAYDDLQGMTQEEAAARVASGDLEQHENPYYQAAFKKQFGIAYAAERKRDLAYAYETEFDKDNGDIEQWLVDRVTEDQGLYAGDEFVYDGIRAGMEGFLDTIRNKHTEYRTGRMQEAVADRFHTTARDTILKAVAQGQDPSAAIRATYADGKNLLGLSYGQMDNTVLLIAEEYAQQGELDIVENLLGSAAQGADGTAVGSFLTKRTTAAKAQGILRRAEAVKTEQATREAFMDNVNLSERASAGELTPADTAVIIEMTTGDQPTMSPSTATRLVMVNKEAVRKKNVQFDIQRAEAQATMAAADIIRSGEWYKLKDTTYVDEDGKTHTFKADDLTKKLVNSMLDQMASRPDVTDAQMAASLSALGTDVLYGEWEQALSNGHTAIHPALNSAGPDGKVVMPPVVTEAFDLWKSLSDFGSLRRRHTGDEAGNRIYRAAEVLERFGGMAPEMALITAAQNDNKSTNTGLTNRIDLQTLQSGVRTAIESRYFDGEGDARNVSDVSAGVEELAREYVKMGLPMQKAIAAAVESYGLTHTVINGVSIATQNNHIPPNFGEASRGLLEELAPTLDLDPDEITLRPHGTSGRFWTVVTTGMMPIGSGGPGTVYATRDIIEHAAAKAETDRVQRLKDANTYRDVTERITGEREWARLAPEHRKNHLENTPGSPEYRKLQKKDGKVRYPDEGYLTDEKAVALGDAQDRANDLIDDGDAALQGVLEGFGRVRDSMMNKVPLNEHDARLMQWLRDNNPNR